MIGVLVTFTQTDKFDPSTVAKIADEERGTFEGMPGLRFKSFTLDDDGQARSFYLWDDEEKARAFFTEEVVDMVTGIYGVAPKIEYSTYWSSSTTLAPDRSDPLSGRGSE